MRPQQQQQRQGHVRVHRPTWQQEQQREQQLRQGPRPWQRNPGAAAKATEDGKSGPSKRTRESETGSSGLTPEAKKARQEQKEQRRYAEATKGSLTLCITEKSGSPVDRDGYHLAKAMFANLVVDIIKDGKSPPKCDPWQYSRAVTKIPAMAEEDLRQIREILEGQYLVQTEEEYRLSQGRVYVAFLRDKFDPKLTFMDQEMLGMFVLNFKREHKIDGLFALKLAAKTPRREISPPRHGQRGGGDLCQERLQDTLRGIRLDIV